MKENIKKKENKKLGIFITIMPFLIIFIFLYLSKWGSAAEYKEYSKEFNMVKDFILEKYPDEDDKILYIHYDTDDKAYLYDSDIKAELECDDEIAKAISIIAREGFSDSENSLDIIRVNSEKIFFKTDNGSYTLAYWPNGVPIFACSQQSEIMYSYPLGDGWYHMAP